MLYQENLLQAATRIANEYGLRFHQLHLVGVYPVHFQIRSDVSIALAASGVDFEPRADCYEFTRFAWFGTPPTQAGANYRRIMRDWMLKRKSKPYLKLSELSKL